jgi:hypothetical protein
MQQQARLLRVHPIHPHRPRRRVPLFLVQVLRNYLPRILRHLELPAPDPPRRVRDILENQSAMSSTKTSPS